MKIVEFCEYFDFCFEAGDFEIEADENKYFYSYARPGHYKYSAIDTQHVFQTRYGNDLADFIEAFESMEEDYVVSVLDGAGFTYNEHIKGTFYEQAYKWLKKLPDYKGTDTFHVVSVFAGKEKLTF